ncbi:MAG: succinate dehydrogenase assembly factor 2 [Candidatus Nitrotoga sp.]
MTGVDQSGVDQSRYLERVRWRCRRGLLELDIVLGRFIALHFAQLDAVQQAAFDTLLDLSDAELWGLVSGESIANEKAPALNRQQETVLKLLRAV